MWILSFTVSRRHNKAMILAKVATIVTWKENRKYADTSTNLHGQNTVLIPRLINMIFNCLLCKKVVCVPPSSTVFPFTPTWLTEKFTLAYLILKSK